MSDSSNLPPDLECLKRDPSLSLWDVEIRRILLGERDAILLQLGSADEYVRVVLASSSDRALAESSFHEALRNVLQTWQPSSFDRQDFLLRLFDLVGSFTPYPGFTKVLDFLLRWRGTGYSTTRYAGRKDIRLTALSVLAAYNRSAAPLMTENAFKAYIAALHGHLEHPEYCGYSARRLLELGVLELRDERIKDLIDRNAECLAGLITLVLAPSRRSVASRDMTQLYMHCLDLGRGMALRFEEELYLLGAHLEHREEDPVVVLLDAHEVALFPDAEHYVSCGRYPEPEDQIEILDERVAEFAAGA